MGMTQEIEGMEIEGEIIEEMIEVPEIEIMTPEIEGMIIEGQEEMMIETIMVPGMVKGEEAEVGVAEVEVEEVGVVETKMREEIKIKEEIKKLPIVIDIWIMKT